MEHRRNRGVLREQRPYLRLSRFHGVRPSSRKENSTPGYLRRIRVRLRYRANQHPKALAISVTGFGNFNPTPFRQLAHKCALSKGIRRWLRID